MFQLEPELVTPSLLHGSNTIAAIPIGFMQAKYFAVVTGEGVGRISTSGSVIWRRSLFYRTSSDGKIAFTNNLVGVFEIEIDANGIFS